MKSSTIDRGLFIAVCAAVVIMATVVIYNSFKITGIESYMAQRREIRDQQINGIEIRLRKLEVK